MLTQGDLKKFNTELVDLMKKHGASLVAINGALVIEVRDQGAAFQTMSSTKINESSLAKLNKLIVEVK